MLIDSIKSGERCNNAEIKKHIAASISARPMRLAVNATTVVLYQPASAKRLPSSSRSFSLTMTWKNFALVPRSLSATPRSRAATRRPSSVSFSATAKPRATSIHATKRAINTAVTALELHREQVTKRDGGEKLQREKRHDASFADRRCEHRFPHIRFNRRNK